MTDPEHVETVDPALFRLREFHREWFLPLIENVRLAASPDVSSWPSDSMDALNLTLAFEAERWIRLGQQVGYFGPATPEVDGNLTELDRYASHFGMQGWFRQTPDLNVEPWEFAYALAGARESLSPERRTFLQLMFFEDDAEYARRLSEVGDTAEALRDRPWLTLLPQTVDQIAWSFEQPDFALSAAWSPASWRTTYVTIAWTQFSPYRASDQHRDTADYRWTTLTRDRNAILAAAAWKIDYEDTPMELRSAEARRASLSEEDTTALPHAWTAEWEEL